MSAAETLFEDNPEVAMYIQSLVQPTTSSSTTTTTTALAPGISDPSNPTPSTSAYQTEALTTSLTDDLISRTGEIMRDAEAHGYDPDERLREVVGQTLMDGWRRNREEAGLVEGAPAAVVVGQQQQQQQQEAGQQQGEEEKGSKRSRME
ncbi:hypothetical protein QFC22_001565 [Naganishia vaughanmartiniae]|uniref:Uncharacterized protein n=1 Tax=Naganishia vaughanmartiniae TaxID=1424756 RepID=A0ACC2XIB2_9TREE|nr:hypothetical protein QFC22_001565 [Naganishia vaughanmartiniae]